MKSSWSKYIALFSILVGFSQLSSATDLSLIPYPRQVRQPGGQFVLPRVVTIRFESAEDRFAAECLAKELQTIDGVHPRVINGAGPGTIILSRDGTKEADRTLHEAGLELAAKSREEGYGLVVDSHRAVIVAHTGAGIFYGVQTLRQLIHPIKETAEIPIVRILDWPSLRWRGVQADMSRGPVPTLEDMKRTVTLLAAYKQNFYMLYFENTFDYPSLPLVGALGGSMSPAEAHELVLFARDYHVLVIPEQESFGHMHLALGNEAYQAMAEVPYGNVLTPTSPDSLKFIGQMFADLNAAFAGPFFHIGADETYELGEGRTKTLVQSKGGGQVYMDYLKQIDTMLLPYHRKILFWGDIAGRHPELLNQIPHDMIAVPWNYWDTTPEAFEKMIRPFNQVGLETWVAPGVSNWSRIYPDYVTGMPNIRVFADVGKRMGSTGLVNTTWMDDGESLFDSTWYGLVYGAAASWQDKLDDSQFGNAYDWAFYRADGHHFEQEVENLTDIHRTLIAAIKTDGDDSLMWVDPFTPRGQKLYLSMAPAAHQVRLLAEKVLADLHSSREQARQNADLLDHVEFAALRFDYLGRKAIYTKYIGDLYQSAQATEAEPHNQVGTALGHIDNTNGLLQDLRDGSTDLRDRYRILWLAGNRPYFLGNILERYQRELDRDQGEIDRFDAIGRAYGKTHTLPPLIHSEIQ